MQNAFVEALVLKAIRRQVADAIRAGTFLSAASCADRIAESYPHLDLDPKAIADELAWAAARAGVPVEIGRRASAGKSACPTRQR
jgi:hypothetical protein